MKDELIRIGAILKTLDKLIKELIKIDDKLYKRLIEDKHDRGKGYIPIIYGRRYEPRHGNNNNYSYRKPYYSLILIELDILTKGKLFKEKGRTD